MTAAEMDQASPFWCFSLRFYNQLGVADACVALQDECGVDVNVLLFFLWLATARRRVSPDVARTVCARAAQWNHDVVAPLRAIRRRLKENSMLVERRVAGEFRTKIKAVELESERLQQEALFALAAGLETEEDVTIEAAANASVRAYEHVMGRTLAPAASTLLGALQRYSTLA